MTYGRMRLAGDERCRVRVIYHQTVDGLSQLHVYQGDIRMPDKMTPMSALPDYFFL